jgi:hypothetical protein
MLLRLGLFRPTMAIREKTVSLDEPLKWNGAFEDM